MIWIILYILAAAVVMGIRYRQLNGFDNCLQVFAFVAWPLIVPAIIMDWGK